MGDFLLRDQADICNYGGSSAVEHHCEVRSQLMIQAVKQGNMIILSVCNTRRITVSEELNEELNVI